MPKLNSNMETVKKVMEVLEQDCSNPADQIVEMGETMIKIGKELRGKTVHEARQIMEAVKLLT